MKFIHRQKAFTLIELLVVILIVVTLSAMAFPLMSGGMGSSEARGTTTRLISMVGLAQSMAASERQTFRLNVDEEKGAFWITFEPDQQERPGEYAELKHSNLARIVLGDSLSLKNWKIEGDPRIEEREQIEPRHYIEFRPDGTADEAIFVFESASGDEYSLLISGMTGRVRLKNEATEIEE